MSFNKNLDEILKELNCLVYTINIENNSICIDKTGMHNQHLMYKEMVDITSTLNDFKIKFEIDLNNNINII